MAAGLGFKDFTTGEVLTAADVDGYLMQGIWVFASTAARDAAVTAPAEGNFAFTKDTNSLWYYDGAAWVASGATGDIEGVTAGVGISGGGTSGTVTVTNSMATAITTAGDTLYGTGSGTFSRLGIGTAGQVLKVNSGATAPEWGAAAGAAGLTKITSNTFSAVSSVSFPNSTFTSTYKDYLVELEITTVSTNATIQGRFRASGTDNTTSNYATVTQGLTSGGSASNVTNSGQNILTLGYLNSGADQFSRAYNFISPQLAVKSKVWGGGVGVNSVFNDRELDTQTLFFDATTQFDSFSIIASTGNFTGRYAVYGLEA